MIWLLILALAASAILMFHYAYRRYARLTRRLRRSEAQYKDVIDFLNLFARSLATVSEIERALELVAHYVCDVMRAESVGIFLLEPDGRKRCLRGAAFAGMFPPFHETADIVLAKASYLHEHLRQERIPVGQGILGSVAKTHQSRLVEDTSFLPPEESLPREVHTLIAVPMLVENRLVGVVCAINCREETRRYNQDDVRMLEGLSYQAALASNLVTVYAERSEQQRILQELDFAREIQHSLLPETPPGWDGYRIHAFSRSAREVGGDFYDFVRIDENRLMVVVADASGKGIPACMLMGMCQSFVRSSVQRYRGLETFLRELNQYLFQDTDRAHFVTVAVCVIDRKNHVCDYARAGHTELLVRLSDRQTRTICPDGPALGLLPEDVGVHFDTLSFSFREGTSLMLFTDGITETLNEEETEFGLERLEQVWQRQSLPPEDMAQTVLGEVGEFQGDVPQADDQTIVIVSRPTGETDSSDRTDTADDSTANG